MRVAVIGAGPSGLVAAKHLIEKGLHPTLFDKNTVLGGMWRPDGPTSWESLHTNLSRFSCCFSEHPWPESASMFPSKQEVFDYLSG